MRHGDVVEEEQRLGPAAERVVDAHRDQVDADRVVLVDERGDFELRAHAVGAGDEDRVFVIPLEQPAGKIGSAARPCGAAAASAGSYPLGSVDRDRHPAQSGGGAAVGAGHPAGRQAEAVRRQPQPFGQPAQRVGVGVRRKADGSARPPRRQPRAAAAPAARQPASSPAPTPTSSRRSGRPSGRGRSLTHPGEPVRPPEVSSAAAPPPRPRLGRRPAAPPWVGSNSPRRSPVRPDGQDKHAGRRPGRAAEADREHGTTFPETPHDPHKHRMLAGTAEPYRRAFMATETDPGRQVRHCPRPPVDRRARA